MDDTVFLFEGFMGGSECHPYISRIQDHWAKHKTHGDCTTNWLKRTVDITGEPIVSRVKEFLQGKLSCKLECSQAQIQIWPKDYEGGLHKHTDNGREDTDFNSMIYLNDNFGGGEFYTDQGVTYKPVTGSLTFFNGSTVMHGVKKVTENDRYTLIFWWKKRTIFYETVFMHDDVLTPEECKEYINKYKDSLKSGSIPIQEDKLSQKIQETVRTHFQANVEVSKTLFVKFTDDIKDELHIHNWFPKRCSCNPMAYNSVLYLNEEFEGGEFYTKAGVSVQPKIGRLIFFNTCIWHGIKKVSGERYSIRCVMKDPIKFYN